jgi:protein disulfide-isomerase
MKQKLFLAVLLTLVALKILVPQSVADGVKPGWLTDYKRALETASREKKAVLLDFTGSDWCVWCIKLRKEVFETAEFSKYAQTNLILVEIDFPRGKPQTNELRQQNRELQEKFRVEGFPTIIVLNSEGKQIGQTGYLPGGPQRFIAQIQSFK